MAWLNRIDEHQLRRVGHGLLDEAQHARDIAADRLNKLGHRAAVTAGRTAHEALEVGQQQAGLIAAQVAREAVRTGRALRRDPVPALVAAFGAVMLFNLVASSAVARKVSRSRR